MNKCAIVDQIIAVLAAELEGYTRSARSAHAEATDEQSKAENKYDTRGLEASYLARGQSKQAAEIMQAIEQFEMLAARKFGIKDPIDISALVELETKGERFFYFIGPRAGGMEILHEKKEVLLITPQSPLGQQLVGKRQGEKLKLEIAGSKSDYLVLSVS